MKTSRWITALTLMGASVDLLEAEGGGCVLRLKSRDGKERVIRP